MTGHQHDDFAIPDDLPDPLGRQVDNRLLSQFVSAAFDQCTSCQDPLLTLLVEDPITTSRLVELACQIVQETLGGLPRNLVDPDAPGVAAPEFRRLAAAGEEDHVDQLHDLCRRMTVTQRRKAANTAADLLIGYLSAMEGPS